MVLETPRNMDVMATQIAGNSNVCSPASSVEQKIKHQIFIGLLLGEPTGDGRFPSQKTSEAKKFLYYMV